MHTLLRQRTLVMWLALILAACGPGRGLRPTGTPLTLPTPTAFIVRARPTPTQPLRPTPPPTDTATPTTPLMPSDTPAPTRSAARPPASASGALSRDQAPAAFEADLRSSGIESDVYWFKSGDEDQLLVQYRSPIRGRPGYDEMLQQVKRIAAANFLRIDPPLLTLYIAATDITGTSDTTLRLDRAAVERWSRGELGDADFYNNGFLPSAVVITCTADGCSGVRPTPFPTFPPFPFPFPTPTP